MHGRTDRKVCENKGMMERIGTLSGLTRNRKVCENKGMMELKKQEIVSVRIEKYVKIGV